MRLTLADMGFDAFFAAQIPAGAPGRPFRITEVHRDRLTALAPSGRRELTTSDGQETGAFAVGDWVLANDAGQVTALLARKSLLHRRAAGTDARQQLIAANCDRLFITTSCNADFNPARIERFLVLAYEGGCVPVILLTKADLVEDAQAWVARAQRLDPRAAVLAVNARDAGDLARVAAHCGSGQSAALVGASGVGKTTLTNGLCARDDATGEIRAGDARGRHVTTSRALRRMLNGGWIIDTPGMRALRLEEVGTGLAVLFEDIAKLALDCRFSDCAHQGEPGCAVREAVAAGRLDPERVARWEKLRAEEARNSEILAEARRRARGRGGRKPGRRPG